MKKETPRNHRIQSQGAGANSPSLPILRITVNRMVYIKYKIRKIGLSLVDIAELARLRFASLFSLMYLGLIDHADLTKLEQVFAKEVGHV